jgi:hypothetical protein
MQLRNIVSWQTWNARLSLCDARIGKNSTKVRHEIPISYYKFARRQRIIYLYTCRTNIERSAPISGIEPLTKADSRQSINFIGKEDDASGIRFAPLPQVLLIRP